ncbi:Inorganic pyrophosphatase [Candidatus Accumulibacter aalborgensis]|uniref:inorganic diphosphatase n=1 Tax=Candidatus Accumulibacter aalborgensis TaxID=1860102 RepID=A0A1A8XVD8_9PROT|nr:Inorganic pyrophosphatase [Candidatus Accumulibacter aalborgensis]
MVRCQSSGHCKLTVHAGRLDPANGHDEPPEVEVVIEVPRGSFLKRGSSGRVDFVSPLPCPFNYGSVPNYLGLEGDLLDALVLGPRLPFGARIRVRAWGAVTLTDRGLSDDKLICSAHALTVAERRSVLCFFHFYARCKGLLNIWRCRPGRNACDGWCAASLAIARAQPLREPWPGPRVGF